MKKFYSFVLFALLSVSAFAEADDAYYWFYDKVVADPTGKGKVYISDGPLEDGEFECQDEMEFKYVNWSWEEERGKKEETEKVKREGKKGAAESG